MSTLADLIRAHERNPRALYKPEVSERVSTPGHYEQTASQRSPALDRRIEKKAARKLGEDLGVDPEDLDKIDDFEDLNDILNGLDPDLRDPPPPLPELPDPPEPPEPPELPDPPVDPIPSLDGLTAYALHSGSISMSEDGGRSWANHTGSPDDPIGFSVSTQGFFVATSTAVHFSPDLLQWRELTIQGDPNLQVSGFSNGSFEGGLSGWEVLSTLTPITGSVAPAIPTDGDSYLMRNWILFSDGEFEVGQEVTLTSAEMAAISGGGTLSFSGDVFGNGGTAELRIERNVDGIPYFRADDLIEGEEEDSDLLTEIVMESADLPDDVTAAKIAFDHTIVYIGSTHSVRFYFRIWLRIDGVWEAWGQTQHYEDDLSSGEGVIRLGQFRQDYYAELTHESLPGTIELFVPNGWKYPIDNSYGGNPDYTDSVGFSETQAVGIGFGTGWVELASISGSDYTWNRIAATTTAPPMSEIRCVIKGTGSPADVYVDNCRLEIVRSAEDLEVTAIGGEWVAINNALYKMSPDGLEFDTSLEFDPTGIVDDGSLAWGGGSIFIRDEDATYSLPQTVVRAFNDPAGALLLMSGGEVWRRNNDPDFPGWDTLGSPGVCADMASIGGGWVALGDNSGDADGFIKSSPDLSTWTTASATSQGTLRILPVGTRLLAYRPGYAPLLWFDHSGWHLAGNLPAGILDISA